MLTARRITEDFQRNQVDLTLPAATTYSYMMQKSRKTGVQRTQLCIAHLTGLNIQSNLSQASNTDLFQAFIPSIVQDASKDEQAQYRNSVVKVQVDADIVRMYRITNKFCYNDSRLPLKERLVTVESGVGPSQADQIELPHQGHVYRSLIKILQEVSAHISSNSSVSLTGGNFFFRLAESANGYYDSIHDDSFDTETVRPILLFASGIKTDHPMKIMYATELKAVFHSCEVQQIQYDHSVAIEEHARQEDEEDKEDGIVNLSRGTTPTVQYKIDGSRPSSIIDIR